MSSRECTALLGELASVPSNDCPAWRESTAASAASSGFPASNLVESAAATLGRSEHSSAVVRAWSARGPAADANPDPA